MFLSSLQKLAPRRLSRPNVLPKKLGLPSVMRFKLPDAFSPGSIAELQVRHPTYTLPQLIMFNISHKEYPELESISPLLPQIHTDMIFSIANALLLADDPKATAALQTIISEYNKTAFDSFLSKSSPEFFQLYINRLIKISDLPSATEVLTLFLERNIPSAEITQSYILLASSLINSLKVPTEKKVEVFKALVSPFTATSTTQGIILLPGYLNANLVRAMVPFENINGIIEFVDYLLQAEKRGIFIKSYQGKHLEMYKEEIGKDDYALKDREDILLEILKGIEQFPEWGGLPDNEKNMLITSIVARFGEITQQEMKFFIADMYKKYGSLGGMKFWKGEV